MAKFDAARAKFSVESLEPAQDSVGKVVGYYLKLGNDAGEVYVGDDFVRSHFTQAPAVIAPTAPSDKLGGEAFAKVDAPKK